MIRPTKLLSAYFAAQAILALMAIGYLAGLATGVGMAVAMLKMVHR